MKILVTGSEGFIGKNLQERLLRIEGIEILKFDSNNTLEELEESVKVADFIFHLAGINRPENPEDFYKGNSDLVGNLINFLEKNGKNTPVLITSSIHVDKENDYGKSKLAGENLLKDYSERNNAPVFIYRLQNVFGKWCRPNYNSVVATWCYNTANDIEISINGRDTSIEFVYIDDVIDSIGSHLNEEKKEKKLYYMVEKTYSRTLGEVADLLELFKENRKSLSIPEVGTGFERSLYATYLSYLPKDKFSYELTEHTDARGSFVEILRTVDSGQFSISTSRPGVTRGNHYHNTKNEKFLVIKGEATLRFRHIFSDEIIEYPVSDKKLEVVDIPTGYTHNITNTGDEDMVLVLWANEQFDKENPDTYYLEV
ncbi:SDR family oxidoreductase [Cetobacterium sp. 2A]|uniref:polysaccharide biosynthesis C-terminal domain-containing protein n=1 Tax=Cetobacterium sp. 2A TaxID=2754723 RepID=UPI00163BEA61|nr:NAD-dependent epimerase/dehydratase family protein [Cetobacterium sp. 2A]MBC2856176.1 SDR family oxidoreductase [Cetobacterium sp. 2A]